MCPFVSVDSGEVLDSKFSKRFVRTTKAIIGNQIKHYFKQMNELGLLPNTMKWIANVVVQSYKGHVTIVPEPSLSDYKNLLVNVTEETYWPAF